MKMHIVVTGATGFIGQKLVKELISNGYEVLAITRNTNKAKKLFEEKIEFFQWNGENKESLKDQLENAYAIINLAGENISGARWSAKQKSKIIDSRTKISKALADAVLECRNKPRVFIQSSAIGFYDNDDSRIFTESDGAGNGFLSEVCQKWEAGIEKLKNQRIRLVTIRSGVVLDKDGGALKKLALPIKWLLGGYPSHGKQSVSWISLHDEIKAILFLLGETSASGIYNLCSPNSVSMRELVKTAGLTLKRPIWLPIPGFLIKLIYGEMGKATILSGQKVLPERLTNEGFVFDYPEIGPALKKIYERKMPKMMSMEEFMQTLDNKKEA
jgi:uncharacterized protein